MTGIRYDLTDTIVPVGDVVGTTDTQNLYNKTLESPIVSAGLTITSGTVTGILAEEIRASNNNGLTLATSGGDLGVFIDSDGQVGVGFTSSTPQAAFHVSADATAAGIYMTTTATGHVTGNGVLIQCDTANRMAFLHYETAQWYLYSSGATRLSGDAGLIFIGDDASPTNTKMTTGLTINQGTADDEILAFKSSDVDHGYTTRAETDTYFYAKKAGGAFGGIFLEAIAVSAGIDEIFSLRARGGQADTTKATGTTGMFHFLATQHDGLNNIADVIADGAVFSIAARSGGSNATRYVLDEQGNSWQDGNARITGTLTVSGDITTADDINVGQTQFINVGGGYIINTGVDFTLNAEAGVNFLFLIDGDDYINIDAGGSVYLYHAGNQKFRTEADGVTVTGNVMPSTADSHNIGSGALVWNNIYCNTLHASAGSVKVGTTTLSYDGTVLRSDTEFKAPSGSDNNSFASIKYVDDEIVGVAGADLTAHMADTTTHGTTGDIVGTSDTQSLSNKEFTDSVSVSGNIRTDGNALIGDFVNIGTTIANTKSTLGLTINQGAADDEILTFKSSDILHDTTGYTEVDTFAYFKKLSGTDGGLEITGFTDVEATALYLRGVMGDSGGTATPAVIIRAEKDDGAQGGQPFDDSEPVMYFVNDTQEALTLYGGPQWMIGDGPPAYNTFMNTGLTIDQGSEDDEILAFKSSDVTHAYTTITETDTYGYFSKVDSGGGGLYIVGIMDGAPNKPIEMLGVATTALTTKDSNADGTINLRGGVIAGGTAGSVGANGNLVTIQDYATTKFIFDAEGDITLAGDILPMATSTQDIGKSGNTFNNIWCETLYTSAGSVHVGGAILSYDGTSLISDTEFKAPSGSDNNSFASIKYADDAISVAGHTQGTDTTLGTMTGDIDMGASNDIYLGDGGLLYMGAAPDSNIGHNGTSALWENSVGSLYIQAKIAENSIVCVPDGAVTLYHNNIAKIATSATGVTVTGVMAGTSSAARYSDLAENYTCEQDFGNGQVILVSQIPGIDVEVSNEVASPRVLGVVSENPGVLMNSEGEGATVARVGKVPCYVEGPIKKGDRIVSSFEGRARKATSAWEISFAFANEPIEEMEIKLIEVIL